MRAAAKNAADGLALSSVADNPVVAAAIDSLRAALAASEGAGLPAGLDAAWAAAEAALPEGWRIWSLVGASDGWIATAGWIEPKHGPIEIAWSEHKPTPAAALEALTRRLISPASDTEERA